MTGKREESHTYLYKPTLGWGSVCRIDETFLDQVEVRICSERIQRVQYGRGPVSVTKLFPHTEAVGLVPFRVLRLNLTVFSSS